MARNNTPMLVLGIMVVTMILGVGTGILDLDSLNIQPEDRSSISSEEIEENESLSDKLLDQVKTITEQSASQSAFYLMIFVLVIILVIFIGTRIAFVHTNELEEKLDEIEKSVEKVERGHEFTLSQGIVRGKYRGRSRPPEKRARQIYGSNDNLHVKLVNELIETGGFNPNILKRKRINNKPKEEVQSLLCPQCKKVHIQTDEEGCWFCNYKWGDIIEHKEY